MGSVYLAADLAQEGRPVALKRIQSDRLTPEITAAFKAEFEAMTLLRHPNVVEVYDFGVDESTGRQYLTMEYVEGTDLDTAARQLPFDQRLDLLVQVCRGLDYIHARGLIHNDLKIQNIIVSATAPLAPDTVYRLVVDGVRDAHGATVTAASLTVRTTTAARVVRFRPVAKSTNVARDVAISVRFTEAMDPASTRKAFSVTAAGAPVTGSIRFAEGNTVLVLVPKTALPYGAKIVATVGAGAKTRSGAPIAAAASATFQTVAKPAATVAGKPVVKIPRPSGGGSVGSGSWGAVERYYLTLMNCTRTGGWVTSSGSCSSPGGRNVAPLTLSSSISTLVSRPYAKRIAMSGDCSHFIGGNPGDRLRHAGFMSYKWAENIGCRQGSPMVTALAAQLFFQSEKPYNGGHYVNMMNALYDRVGIGIWLYSGRTRLVIDFYHP